MTSDARWGLNASILGATIISVRVSELNRYANRPTNWALNVDIPTSSFLEEKSGGTPGEDHRRPRARQVRVAGGEHLDLHAPQRIRRRRAGAIVLVKAHEEALGIAVVDVPQRR